MNGAVLIGSWCSQHFGQWLRGSVDSRKIEARLHLLPMHSQQARLAAVIEQPDRYQVVPTGNTLDRGRLQNHLVGTPQCLSDYNRVGRIEGILELYFQPSAWWDPFTELQGDAILRSQFRFPHRSLFHRLGANRAT